VSDAYIGRAKAYKGLGEFEKSLEDFNWVIHFKPSEKNLNGRGILYIKMGKSASALEDFKEAIKLDPHYAASYFNLGNLLFNQQKHKEAVTFYTQAIQRKSSNPTYFYHRGLAHDNLNQYQEASKDLNHAASMGFHVDPKLLMRIRRESHR